MFEGKAVVVNPPWAPCGYTSGMIESQLHFNSAETQYEQIQCVTNVQINEYISNFGFMFIVKMFMPL